MKQSYVCVSQRHRHFHSTVATFEHTKSDISQMSLFIGKVYLSYRRNLTRAFAVRSHDIWTFKKLETKSRRFSSVEGHACLKDLKPHGVKITFFTRRLKWRLWTVKWITLEIFRFRTRGPVLIFSTQNTWINCKMLLKVLFCGQVSHTVLVVFTSYYLLYYTSFVFSFLYVHGSPPHKRGGSW